MILSQTNSMAAIPSFRSSVAARSACCGLCCLCLWAVRERSITAYRPKYAELGKAERMGCPQFNQESDRG